MKSFWVALPFYLAEKFKQLFNRSTSSCFITFFPLAWESCMDPSLNTLLMDCRISLNLLHMQVKLKDFVIKDYLSHIHLIFYTKS